MTTEAISLDIAPREVLGKKVKRLRQEGIVPVHLYGPSVKSRSLQCSQQELVRALSRAGASTTITLQIQGDRGGQLAFAREIQWDPVRGDILHVDFLALEANRPVSAQVPISLVGESPAARQVSGMAVQHAYAVDIEALPLEMPAQIEVDLEQLTDPDEVIRTGDLVLPPNVTLVSSEDELVVRVEIPRAVEEEEEVAEEEEEEEVEGEVEAEPSEDTGEEGDSQG